MKLIIRPGKNAEELAYAISDGQNNQQYRVQMISSGCKREIRISEVTGRIVSEITIKSGLFREEASYRTKSGDLITVTRKGRPERKMLTVSGCDWAVQGTEFPSSYYVHGGYGRIVTIITGMDRTEAELSITAVTQDVLCFVASIMFLFDQKN